MNACPRAFVVRHRISVDPGRCHVAGDAVEIGELHERLVLLDRRLYLLFDEEQACGDCGLAVNCVGVKRPTLSNCLGECERQYLVQELTRHDWRMAKTAAAIGISRKNLWEPLRRLKLMVPTRALSGDVEQTPD